MRARFVPLVLILLLGACATHTELPAPPMPSASNGMHSVEAPDTWKTEMPQWQGDSAAQVTTYVTESIQILQLQDPALGVLDFTLLQGRGPEAVCNKPSGNLQAVAACEDGISLVVDEGKLAELARTSGPNHINAFAAMIDGISQLFEARQSSYRPDAAEKGVRFCSDGRRTLFLLQTGALRDDTVGGVRAYFEKLDAELPADVMGPFTRGYSGGTVC